MKHARFQGELVAGALLSLVALGCGGTLQVKKMDFVTQPPGNVAVYFTVDDKDGRPIPDLSAAAFQVYEDGKLVPDKRAKRALLDPRVAMFQSTLVLVDIGGPIADSEEMPVLVSAVARLAERLSRLQEVAVSAFDGGDQLIPVLSYESNDVRGPMDRLRMVRPRSRASNVNGAILEGLKVLKQRRAAAPAPHTFSNLVVFTDRGDLAHKATAADVSNAVRKAEVNLYVIGVGERVKKDELAELASVGAVISPEPKDLVRAFADVGKRMDATSANHYVLSYCSPKRHGKHTLELEVAALGDTGRIQQKFNADEFDGDCAPRKRPVFGQAVASRGKNRKN